MTASDDGHYHASFVILCRIHTNSKYEYAEQGENDYVLSSEVVIKNEAYEEDEKKMLQPEDEETHL